MTVFSNEARDFFVIKSTNKASVYCQQLFLGFWTRVSALRLSLGELKTKKNL